MPAEAAGRPLAVRAPRARHRRGRCPGTRARGRGGAPRRAASSATGRRPNIDTRAATRGGDQGACRPARARATAAASSTRPRRHLGGLDIVVNNAATLVRRGFLELELDDLDAAWEVNLRAPALIMQESFEYLREAEAPGDRQRRLDRRCQRRDRDGERLRDEQGRPDRPHQGRRPRVRAARDPRVRALAPVARLRDAALAPGRAPGAGAVDERPRPARQRPRRLRVSRCSRRAAPAGS